jgi:hypothetical protein
MTAAVWHSICVDKNPPETSPEFSFTVRRSAKGTEVRAAAHGAPAVVLAIATILIAAALAVGWVLREYGGSATRVERDLRSARTARG